MVTRTHRSSRNVGIRLGAVGIAVALFGNQTPTQSPELRFGVMDTGGLSGPSASAYDINEFGQIIVGEAQTASGAYHAFAQGYDGLRDLGTLGGARSSALGVNYVIVGESQTASGQVHAFSYEYWRPGAAMVDLGTLGGTWSAAYDADFSFIVGGSKIAGDTRIDAFIIRNGAMVPLAATWGGDSEAKAIANELPVGYACTAGNASCKAVQFVDGVATALFPYPGNSIATAVNMNGEIAGTYTLAGGRKHAV